MKYNIFINNGNEYLDVEGRSISISEELTTVSNEFIADYIHKENPTLPEAVIMSVLDAFCIGSAKLMAEGIAIQLKKGNDVALRIYPDVRIKDGNINLERARKLNPEVTEITRENAADLVNRAGITVKVKAESEQKFTELMKKYKITFEKDNIIERDKIVRPADDSDSDTNTVDTSTGTVDTSTGNTGGGNGGSDLPPGNG